MYILLVASVFLAVLKTSIYNSYAKQVAPDSTGVLRFNTVSYGIAAANEHPGLSFEGLLKTADNMMYQRKKQQTGCR
jgi:GGDEF domain-containing protein